MKVKFTKENFTYRDINERAFPDWECFGAKNMVDNFSQATRMLYRYSRTYPRPFIIVTARGCPFHCTFCKRHPEKYRARSIENIMAEIAVNYEKYKFNILIVQDELFAVNKQRMRDFCTELIANKETFGWDFDWMMQTHANSKLDLDTLQLAKKSGLYLFSYGLESASPPILKSMRKHTQPLQILEAIKLADQIGIGFAGNLIFGDPAETEDTIRESLNFYLQHGIDQSVFLSFVCPYPGSELFDYCIEKGIIKDKLHYYEHIDENIKNMTQIPDDLFLAWCKFILEIDHSYLLIKQTEAYKCELAGEDTMARMAGLELWRIYARCPHCGQECAYTQIMNSTMLGQFTVPLCQHCNKRIRVNIPKGLKVWGLDENLRVERKEQI